MVSLRLNGQAIVTDTIPKIKMFPPTLIRIGTDFLGLAHTAINDNRDAWEVQGEIDIYRYFLTFEYGHETNTFTREDQYDYKSDGTYWRFGVDVNMIPRDAYGGVLYFGLRYAQGIFDEQMTGTAFHPQWGNTEFEVSNMDVQANWVEVVTGMKGKVWKNLYLGYALRLKASLKIKDQANLELDPYRIPGFGLAGQNSFFGINYYVAWQFPFRQKYTFPRQP